MTFIKSPDLNPVSNTSLASVLSSPADDTRRVAVRDRGLARHRWDGAAPAAVRVSSLQPLGGQQSVRENRAVQNAAK